MITPEEIVKNKMFISDAFSQWMGIEIEAVAEGYCRVRMKVRPEMLNGFNILHGGISYSLADSAFAFACNTYGQQAVSIESSISHVKKVKSGEILIAEAKMKSHGKNIGIYEVVVTNEQLETIALFKGTAYHTAKVWEK